MNTNFEILFKPHDDRLLHDDKLLSVKLPTNDYESLLDIFDYVSENKISISPTSFIYNEVSYNYSFLEKTEDLYLLNDLLNTLEERQELDSLRPLLDEEKKVFDLLLHYFEQPSFNQKNDLLIRTMNHYFESPVHFNQLIQHYKMNVLETYENNLKSNKSEVAETVPLYKVKNTPFSYEMLARCFDENEISEMCTKYEDFKSDLLKTNFFIEHPTYSTEIIRVDTELKDQMNHSILQAFEMDLNEVYTSFKLSDVIPVDVVQINDKYPYLKNEIREIQYSHIMNSNNETKESILNRLLDDIKLDFDKYVSMIPVNENVTERTEYVI